ncbi:helix-turn-helix domain-containing protein [Mycolicibacter virginiensis]
MQRWIAEGRLPAIRPGGRNYRVLESDLNAFIDGSRVTVGGAA